MPDLPQRHEKMGPTQNPPEQRTPDGGKPFDGGGRHADLPFDYQQSEAADADYRDNLRRNARQDRESMGVQKSLDSTPWVGRGRGRNAG